MLVSRHNIASKTIDYIVGKWDLQSYSVVHYVYQFEFEIKGREMYKEVLLVRVKMPILTIKNPGNLKLSATRHAVNTAWSEITWLSCLLKGS